MNQKIKLPILSEVPIIDPKQLQQNEIEKEEKARFSIIAKKVLDVLGEEKVLFDEIPRVITSLTGLINNIIDKSEISTLCNTAKPKENV